MRIRTIRGGYAVPVNNEEEDLIVLAEKDDGVPRFCLDERQRELAHRLVSRGLLRRISREDKTYYVPNELDDVWRN